MYVLKCGHLICQTCTERQICSDPDIQKLIFKNEWASVAEIMKILDHDEKQKSVQCNKCRIYVRRSGPFQQLLLE